jgi:spore germination protein KC
MNRRWLSLLLTFTLLLLLTGCWDRRELNELAISVAIGIDKVGSQYQVTVQVVQPGVVAAKKGGSGGATPVTMSQAKGATIFEAIRKMATDSPRKIYAAHLRVAVIGEELAREGIGNALDLLSRNYEFRMDFYLLVAKGTTAANVLNILTPLEKIPASKLFGAIETSEKVWAPVMAVTLDKFIMDYGSMGKNPVLSGIKVSGDDEKGGTKGNLETIRPAAQLRNTGLAVFRKDKLIGWLNEKESKGYNYILNNVSSTVGHLACPQGGNVAVEVIRSKAEMKGSVNNGLPRLAVELLVEQNVGEVQCRIDLTKVKAIQDLERIAEQALKETLDSSIKAAQSKYKADIFGFGNTIHHSDPGAWKSIKAEWDKLFEKTVVDVTVKVKLRRTGTMTNSFLEEGRK